ncbi:hypothetical protein BURMUCF1_0423 [Burkholderia multivorans ATCC BAA-247]|nr:hypothetical protein BURMUCF1_0423 [Burkholderia multivorans ATCC BAA-247]
MVPPSTKRRRRAGLPLIGRPALAALLQDFAAASLPAAGC